MAKKRAAKPTASQTDTKQDIADPVSLSNAAKLAGCSARTIRRKIDSGLLRVTRQGRSIFVSESEVRQLDKVTGHAADTPHGNGHLEARLKDQQEQLTEHKEREAAAWKMFMDEKAQHDQERKLLTAGRDELAQLGARVAAAEASQRGAWILAAVLGVVAVALTVALIYVKP